MRALPNLTATPPAPVLAFINHVLTQQPWARERLRLHAARTVRVSAAPFDFTLAIGPSGLVQAADSGVSVDNGSHQGSQADVVLQIPLVNLPWFVLDPERATKDVRIEGDAELAQTLNALARELRWDAEEDLSRVTGDIAAHRLMAGARSLQAWARDATQRFTETASAFLIDEDPTLVRKQMAEQFSRDVAALRDDAARLDKRLAQLEAQRRV